MYIVLKPSIPTCVKDSVQACVRLNLSGMCQAESVRNLSG